MLDVISKFLTLANDLKMRTYSMYSHTSKLSVCASKTASLFIVIALLHSTSIARAESLPSVNNAVQLADNSGNTVAHSSTLPKNATATQERIWAIIAEQAEKANKSGHVFRAPARWANYYNHSDMRYIFDGSGDAIGPNSRLFGILFNFYIVAYSDLCGRHLPDGSAVYEMRKRTEVFNGYGFKVSNYETLVNRTVVRPDLVPLYDNYRSKQLGAPVAASWFRGFLGGGSSGTASTFQRQLEMYEQAKEDMVRFLKNEGCRSPAQFQFETNLVRHATSRPSLQEAGEPVPGYEQESDAGRRLYLPETLTEACAIHWDYRYSRYEECKCVDDRASATLTEGEISASIDDFSKMLKTTIPFGCRL